MTSEKAHLLTVVLGCAVAVAGSATDGVERSVSSEAADPNARPAVATLSSGDLVVAWRGAEEAGESHPILVRRLAGDGTPLAPAERVATVTGQPDGPAVAALADGGFVVVWAGSLPSPLPVGVFARVVDLNGWPRGEEILVASRPFSATRSVAVAGVSDGGFVVVFAGADAYETRILARPFDWQGEASGEAVPLDPLSSGYQSEPAVAPLPGGGAAVAWVSAVSGGDGSTVRARRLDASGAPDGAVTLISDAVSGWCGAPAISVDAEGAAAVTWRRTTWPELSPQAGIRRRLVDPAGEPLGDEQVVHPHSDGAAAVARQADGAFLVAWDATGQLSSDDPLTARRFTANGATLGHPFRVDPADGGWHQAPALAVTAAGGFVAVYGRSRDQTGTHYLFARLLPAEPSPGTLQLVARELRLAEGDRAAALRVIRSGGADGEVAVRYATTSVTAIPWIDFVPVTDTLSFPDGDDQLRAAVVQILADAVADGDRELTVGLADPSGGAELVAPTTASILILDDDFAPPQPGPAALGPEAAVGEPGPQREGAAVASVGSDRFLVAWREGGDDGQLVVRPFSARGEALGPPSSLADRVDPGSSHALASDGVSAFVAWVAGNVLYGQRLGPTGTPLAPAAQIAIGDCTAVWSCTWVRTAGVASLGNGRYLVGWSLLWPVYHGFPGVSILARQVAADDRLEGMEATLGSGGSINFQGVALGANRTGAAIVAVAWRDSGVSAFSWDSAGAAARRLPVVTPSSARAPAVAVDESGGFALAWVDDDVSGYQEWTDVLAARFASDGTALRSPVRLNRSTAQIQSDPALAVDATGNLSAVWQSAGQDGDGAGVFGQRFTPGDVPAGGEYQVSEASAGHQGRPATAADPDGRSLVVWHSWSDAGPAEVVVRGFAASEHSPPPRPAGARLRP